MKYMGSKNRIAKYIVPFLNSYLSDSRRFYIEPFVGGANVIDKVDFEFRIAYDKNVYLIALLDYVAKGGILPDTISEDVYLKVRDNMGKYPEWKVGLVGFCASYGGRFFEGYPRGLNSNGTARDYTNEAIRNLEQQRNGLRGITFHSSDYLNSDFRDKDALIYCDPPYENSKPYRVSLLGKVDYKKYWDWVREQSEVNPVITSEYSAPNDFICIWEMSGLTSNLKATGTKQSTERLFVAPKWSKQSIDLFNIAS